MSPVAASTHVGGDAFAIKEDFDGASKRPRTQRSIMPTQASTFALSRGFLGRAGSAAVP